jgi:hypothetical protein
MQSIPPQNLPTSFSAPGEAVQSASTSHSHKLLSSSMAVAGELAWLPGVSDIADAFSQSGACQSECLNKNLNSRTSSISGSSGASESFGNRKRKLVKGVKTRTVPKKRAKMESLAVPKSSRQWSKVPFMPPNVCPMRFGSVMQSIPSSSVCLFHSHDTLLAL